MNAMISTCRRYADGMRARYLLRGIEHRHSRRHRQFSCANISYLRHYAAHRRRFLMSMTMASRAASNAASHLAIIRGARRRQLCGHRPTQACRFARYRRRHAYKPDMTWLCASPYVVKSSHILLHMRRLQFWYGDEARQSANTDQMM